MSCVSISTEVLPKSTLMFCASIFQWNSIFRLQKNVDNIRQIQFRTEEKGLTRSNFTAEKRQHLDFHLCFRSSGSEHSRFVQARATGPVHHTHVCCFREPRTQGEVVDGFFSSEVTCQDITLSVSWLHNSSNIISKFTHNWIMT